MLGISIGSPHLEKLNDSWVSEVSIPLKEQFGRVPKEGDQWGFNITRHWARDDEWITLSPGLVKFHTPEIRCFASIFLLPRYG